MISETYGVIHVIDGGEKATQICIIKRISGFSNLVCEAMVSCFV